ncbi:hypothetical protein F6476_18805 [Pseudomonas umsongensis]|nr:hypothetical protein F6476_18805 [Pseudomonas umsongensis]
MSNRRTVAMVVNDNAIRLTPRGELRFFASMLAPTGGSAMGIRMHKARPGAGLFQVWFSRS